MLKVIIKKDQISLLGHAMYDIHGKDIVCASASSIFITTVNGILSFDKDNLDVKVEKDRIVMDVLKQNEIVDKLINNMIDLLEQLKNDYPENIEISKED